MDAVGKQSTGKGNDQESGKCSEVHGFFLSAKVTVNTLILLGATLRHTLP